MTFEESTGGVRRPLSPTPLCTDRFRWFEGGGFFLVQEGEAARSSLDNERIGPSSAAYRLIRKISRFGERTEFGIGLAFEIQICPFLSFRELSMNRVI